MWKTIDGKEGAHYSVMSIAHLGNEMRALREMFPEGEADELNFVLFSTSGVHGTYSTIENAEESFARGEFHHVTFVICHPRLVAMRYGNCEPHNADDFAFLKKLRASSWKAVQGIGKHNS